MKKEVIFSLIGYVCLLIVGGVTGLWIYIANNTNSFDEAKQQYLSYFPTVLVSGTLLCFISIAIAAVGLFCITMASKYIISKTWTTVNIIVTIFLGLILFLNVWSLM